MPIIEGPIQGHAHKGVKDIETYRTVHTTAMKNFEKDVNEIDTPRKAYINHGRWVVNCVCNGAGLTSREFGVTCCFDCGRVYTEIIFPENAQLIESMLLGRTNQAERNWNIGESIELLEKENLNFGVNNGMDRS
jgi:hypothetical protein